MLCGFYCCQQKDSLECYEGNNANYIEIVVPLAWSEYRQDKLYEADKREKDVIGHFKSIFHVAGGNQPLE